VLLGIVVAIAILALGKTMYSTPSAAAGTGKDESVRSAAPVAKSIVKTVLGVIIAILSVLVALLLSVIVSIVMLVISIFAALNSFFEQCAAIVPQ
jgi:hypothetical protein